MRAATGLLALAACTAAGPAPRAGSRPAAEVVAAPGPTTAATTAVTPPAAATRGEPFRREGDVAAQVDALTFWGFSADGQRFAFETFYAGPGGARCEGEVDLFVVDVARDAYVPGGHVEIKHRDPEGEPCDPPDLRAAMEARRAGLLEAQGIVVGAFAPPAAPIPIGDDRVDIFLVDLARGRTGSLDIDVLDGGRERAHEGAGAGFKLTLTVGGRSIVVEPGARRRPYVWDYDPGRGLVFVSPDGRNAAFLTATIALSYEGDRTSFMANGVRLPDP